MDNKAYLDQIAVKGKKAMPGKPLLTPAIIKLLAAGIVAIILIFVVIAMLNSNNSKITQKYEALYARATNLVEESGPLVLYDQKLKSSTLRQYNSTFKSTVDSFNSTYSGMTTTAGFDPLSLSSEVTEEESKNNYTIESQLSTGYLNGTLDEVYAATMYYQVSVLLSMNEEAMTASTNVELSSVLNNFKTELVELQKLYKNYTDYK